MRDGHATSNPVVFPFHLAHHTERSPIRPAPLLDVLKAGGIVGELGSEVLYRILLLFWNCLVAAVHGINSFRRVGTWNNHL
jgi:hypothetical protein